MSGWADIRPHESLRVMDLAKEAGVNVSDWKNYRHGDTRAAANPKYCYEWCFIEANTVVVLNLWHREMEHRDEFVWRALNLRNSADRETKPNRKRRALDMDRAIWIAFTEGLPVRVIVLEGTRPGPTDPSQKGLRASKRLLDPISWAVSDYELSSGRCTITRGAVPEKHTDDDDSDGEQGFEGAAKWRYVIHRSRERRLRHRKLQEAKRINNGRLVCEVRGCGFDFAERYGEIGIDYAQVHHKERLSAAPHEGWNVALKELAVVCANCHSMIHRGGQCRSIDKLIPRPNV